MKRKIIFLLWMFLLPAQVVFSQSYSSKNNYTGSWETPSSWNPAWTLPNSSNLSGYNITINGYITVNGSLSFSGIGSNLIINDTLVIKGNLLLDNNTTITLNDNGILIIRGNLTISGQSVIIANSYLIVTGDIIHNSSDFQGQFTSNDNPVRVFVGGTISPVILTNNYPNFPVLNCTALITTPYPNSTCSYGNMTDMISNPINTFFQYTCKVSNVKSNISVCVANTIDLTSSSGTAYSWSGPNGFTSSAQNPSIPNATAAMAGAYKITLIAAPGCTDTDTINVTVIALPIATAGSNSPVCAGSIINLTSSGGTGYSWVGPNGFTTNAQNLLIPNATTAMSGTYAVTVTAATGCKVTKSTNVIVNALSTAIAGSNSPVCVGSSINLTSSGGISYNWSGPNGFVSSLQNPSKPNASTAMAGAYTVTVNDVNGCTATKTTNVIVNTLPITTAGSNSPVCEGNTIILTSSGGTVYNWNGPNGFTSSIQNPSINNASTVMAGTYAVTVTAATGCIATNTTSVIINALPISTAGSNSPVCVGNSINLTSSGGTSYSWSGPNGFTSNVQNPSISNANTTMTGEYRVTVKNASGCTALNRTNVIVNVLPAAGSNSPVCAGNTINLISSDGTSYSWSGPNGFTSNTQNPSIPNASTAMAGVYTLTVTVGTSCTVTTTTSVIVNALTVVTAGSNIPVCEGNIIYLTSSGGTGYSWIGPNGFNSSEQNPAILNASASMTGDYTITTTAINGCTNKASTSVMVIALPLVSITSSSSSMCLNDQRTLTGSPAGGNFRISSGPGTIKGNVLSVKGTGIINLEYNYTNVCTNKAMQSIIVNEYPVALTGPDQVLQFVYETDMMAELSSSETGEWSLISGSGHISNFRSPKARVTGLSGGENIFLWKVWNGKCEASAQVKITVYDPVIPSVITPDGDGKNDYFKIGEIINQVELTIFNRWGNEEYTNSNYSNDWDGRNNKGAELPNDTYFYILKFESGKIIKGSVLIKR